MLAGIISWWLARFIEMLPTAWTNAAPGPGDGIVVDADSNRVVAVSMRRKGRYSPISLGAAARQAGQKPVLLRPPAEFVLVKHHTVPTAPRRQMGQLLRHELGRVTPFPAEELFWRWDGHVKPNNRTRTEVTLTMVPRITLAAALTALDATGLKVDFVEVGPPERPKRLATGDAAHRSTGTIMVHGLAGACVILTVVALLLPLGLQAFALYRTNAAIAQLQPAISQVDTFRRMIASHDAGRDILAQEMERTGDVLQTLAMVTGLLPDDTFLTDFSLRDRQMTLSGRSASAPRLITGLSADPAIRNTAFAAPVTRIEGATADVFSIKAEIAK
jgi:general secretion pathway protein L